MKKLLSFALISAFFSLQVSAGTQNSLKQAFDELNFNLSVEWDQKDKEFYKESTKKFQEEVASLQQNGLTNSELIDFAKNQIKDAKYQQELETAINLIQLNTLSQSEARKLIINSLEKSYSEGASWSSDATYIVAASVLLAIVVVAAVVSPSTPGYSNPGYGCYDDYVCYDYYDSWGYYWYSDCYWTTYCY